MRAIGVNRRPADNRLAAAVPTARRKVDALGGTVLRTATDQRRAVKAARSGRLTETVAPAPGAVRHAGAGRARERDRAGASGPQPTPRFPARARCSTAASTPRNLTSGRRSWRLAPKSLMPEGVGPGRAGPIFIAASRSQDVMRSARRDRRGSIVSLADGWNSMASRAGQAAFSRTLRHLAVRQVPPERDQQPPGEGDDRDPADPPTFLAHARPEPPRG